jgi:hypothetical protein
VLVRAERPQGVAGPSGLADSQSTGWRIRKDSIGKLGPNWERVNGPEVHTRSRKRPGRCRISDQAGWKYFFTAQMGPPYHADSSI